MRNWTEDQIKVILIRHGRTEANREHRYLGRTDEGLSGEGRDMLLEAGRAGRYPPADILFSGPMKRCLETAGILYPDRQPVVVPEWTEIDFGAFEGKNYAELQGDARYQAWIDSGGTLPFPDGESRECFILRCVRGFERMLGQIAGISCGNVGMIVHGGTIMALLSRYCGGAYFDYQVPNGGGYVCTLAGAGGKYVLAEPEVIRAPSGPETTK